MAKSVVMLQDDQERWVVRGEVDAASRMHAIERVADDSGQWIAVSRGQMNPMEVQPAMAFRVVKDGPAGRPTDEEKQELQAA